MSPRGMSSAFALAGVLVTPAVALAQGAEPAPLELPPPPALPPPAPSSVVIVTPPAPPLVIHDPPLPDESGRPRGFSAKLWAGPAYRRLYDFGISAADLGVALGTQRGWYGEIEGQIGRTDQGLLTYQIRAGVTGELHLGRVGLGLGAAMSMIGIRRATTDGWMEGFAVGASAFASVDLIAGERNALFLAGRMTVDWLPGSGTDSDGLLWGPSAMLGWRY